MNNLRSGILVKYLPSGEFFYLSHFVKHTDTCYGYVIKADEHYTAEMKELVHSSCLNHGECELLVEQIPIYTLNLIVRKFADEQGDYVVPLKYEVGQRIKNKKGKSFEVIGYKIDSEVPHYIYIGKSLDENNKHECFDFFDEEVTRDKTDILFPYALPVPAELPHLTNWEIFFLLLKSFAQSTLDLIRKG